MPRPCARFVALVTLVTNKGPLKLLGEWMQWVTEGTTSKLCHPRAAQAHGLRPSFPDVPTAAQQTDGSLG